MNTKTYKDLIVWQKSMDLVMEVYKLTQNFPECEKYGLSSQLRRAAVSMPSNIAEGKMRGAPGEFRRFLLIAYASGAETETQLEISKKLRYCAIKEYEAVDSLLNEIMRILNKLISNN
ncbi:MAG: four helix bundle protein [Candidatus Falkowbacteria bacterium]